MSKIGNLKPTGPGDFWSDLRGDIRTLSFKANIRIAAISDPSANPDAPTHRVYVRDAEGEMMELGGAWKRDINRGPNAGDQFLSVTLDDPSFPHPLNFAVFKDGDVASATWRRRQEQSA
ncbi:DUF736 domain-containing protein [Maricaulis virginensis]|uniref:DUF736 domain-containing protein n=1 Tax=Maricaulis virginensis TaxID=144022 RepID=A0A9W6MMD8_9PROT|nr:DUF736 domain-containing protein [Maricaulis virginensis]GLK50878.1 hypothetical protein GCM10017621_03860 [Maricaulis virginensis]